MIHLDLSLIVSGSRLIIHIQLNWSSEYTHFHNLLKLTVSVHFSGQWACRDGIFAANFLHFCTSVSFG